MLANTARRRADETAFIFLREGTASPERLGCAELERRAKLVAGALQSVARTGDRALLLYPPGLEFIVAFFGCLYAGVIAVPAYPPTRNQRSSRLQAIVLDARPALVLTSGRVRALSSAPDASSEWEGLPLMSTDDLLDGPAWSPPPISHDDVALLQYTSGSTSTPKGVMVTHGNLLHNSECIRRSFALSRQSISVSWLPTFHDMGLIDGVIQPLYTGFLAVLMSPTAFLQHPIRWLQAISDYRATHSGGPDFAYSLCTKKVPPEQRARLDLSCWQSAYNGSEPVRARTLREFAVEFECCGFRPSFFYPCYGLAEATLMVTGGLVDEQPTVCELEADALAKGRVTSRVRTSEDEPPACERLSSLVSCGRPCVNSEVIIANPDSCTVAQEDEVGEIWIAGPSVAAGYWRQVDATEQTFRAFLRDTGEGPFLRTGDLGVLRHGELFVTGRMKDLLIIRGRNHYPQDIELTSEQSHQALRAGSSAAFAVEVDDAEELVAVAEVERGHLRKLDAEAVFRAMREAIAREHELRVHAIVLLAPGRIPKTSSGKIQRQLCRTQFIAGELPAVGSSVLPPQQQSTMSSPNWSGDELRRFPAERRAAHVRDYMLQLVSHATKQPSEVVPETSLASLGVDSLMAAQLQHRLESELGVVLSPAEFLQDAGVAQLTERVLERLGESPPSSPAVEFATNERRDDLSAGQLALWFLHQASSESSAYNVSLCVRIVSELDVDALAEAWSAIAERHLLLRTTFDGGGQEPVPTMRPGAAGVPLESVDAEAWSQERFDAYLCALTQSSFAFDNGPPIRASLCRRGGDAHVLVVVAHHIISDLWSLELILQDLSRAYSASKLKQRPLWAASSSLYAGYVAHQSAMLAGPRGEKLWNYWQRQLSGAQLLLELPLDHPRPPVQSFRGAAVVHRFSQELASDLQNLARSRGVTKYMFLLAAYQAFLYRYTGQEDIVVGSSVSGRTRAEFAETVGYFANQVAMRARLTGSLAFSFLLDQVKQTTIDALEHQDFPFPLLVNRLKPQRDPRFSPLFQTMFSLERPHRIAKLGALLSGADSVRLTLGDLELESYPLECRTAQFDLSLRVVDTDTSLIAFWEYSSDLFDRTTIERMSKHFERLLGAVVENVDRPVGALPLLGELEREQMLYEWNDTKTAYADDKCVHQLFEAQVENTPEAVALTLGTGEIAYRQLNDLANRVANRLRRARCGPESLVGICLPRSVEMVVALLGVLKVGSAYVPMDPSYPQQRLSDMLADAGVTVLLTQNSPLVPALPGLSELLVLSLDAGLSEFANESTANIEGGVTPDNLAYVIYTSGSSGKPKGTMITHRGVVNYLCWCVRYYAVAKGNGAPVNTSFGFDATVTSLLAPLMVGAAVHLLPEEGELAALCDVLRAKANFSLIKITPAHLELLNDMLPPERMPESVRALVIGGEALSFSSLSFWQTHAPTTRLINEYGPTEAVVGCCVHEVSAGMRGSGAVPIGRPIANTRLYILDARLEPVPIGVPGELHIGGLGVARGYLNRPELTQAKFIRDPFRAGEDARMYKTGDWVRKRADGVIEFIGRMDTQVKIRGFRVELGEIEAALVQHSSVRAATVILHTFSANDKRLIAFVVALRTGEQLDVNELRQFLRGLLPQHMLPSIIVPLDELPLTSNGKIDREHLSNLDCLRAELSNNTLPTTPLERVIAATWQQALHVDRIGLHDNFFDLGGHSLLLTQIRATLRQELGRDISLVELLQFATVSSLAQRLAGGLEPSPDVGAIHDRAHKRSSALKVRRKMAQRERK